MSTQQGWRPLQVVEIRENTCENTKKTHVVVKSARSKINFMVTLNENNWGAINGLN